MIDVVRWLMLSLVGLAMLFFAFEYRAIAIRLDTERSRVSACVEERRQCGKDLDWCQTTVRGTLFYITEKLLDDGTTEGRPGR